MNIHFADQCVVTFLSIFLQYSNEQQICSVIEPALQALKEGGGRENAREMLAFATHAIFNMHDTSCAA